MHSMPFGLYEVLVEMNICMHACIYLCMRMVSSAEIQRGQKLSLSCDLDIGDTYKVYAWIKQ